MYKVHKEVKISAGHFLTTLPPEHSCSRQHGHNYKVEVELQSESLNEHGMVLDFGVISQIVKTFDHQNLNDLLVGRSSTAENLATAIKSLLEAEILDSVRVSAENYKAPDRRIEVVKVRVWETDSSWAEVS